MKAPLRIGEIAVYTIVDIDDQEWPASVLIPDSTPELLNLATEFAPAESYNAATGGLRLQFGGFLLEINGRRILVDTGVGAHKVRGDDPLWNLRTDRAFLDSLEECGFDCDSIEVVVATHAHVDHVGWHTVLSEGRWVPTFPNAKYIFVLEELEYWLSRFDEDPGVNFGSTGDSIVPLLRQRRVITVEDGYELASGITIDVHPGHTPGNSVVWLRSMGESAAICGDIVHHPIQLLYPDWSSGYCSDHQMSCDSRRSVLDEISDAEAILLPNHFRIPPARLHKTEGHYSRLPLDR